MKIDLVAPEDFEFHQDIFRREFFPSLEETWTLAPGVAAGLFESALALAQIYSHKKNIAVIQGNSPTLEPMVSWFLREAYQVQKKNWAELLTEQERVQWVDGLHKETVMVLFAEDNPVTGQISEWQHVDELLNKKRLFSIRIAHQSYGQDRNPILPYSLQICSLGPALAMRGAGSRFRIHPSFSHRWRPPVDWVELVRARLATPYLEQKKIEKFEADFALARFLPEKTKRSNDRCILSFADVSGEALANELHGRGFPEVETANLCNWDSMKLYRDWWTPAPTPEALRGMVVIPAQYLKDSQVLQEALTESLAQLRSRQNWGP